MNEPYEPIDMNEFREKALYADCRELKERMESRAMSVFMAPVSPVSFMMRG